MGLISRVSSRTYRKIKMKLVTVIAYTDSQLVEFILKKMGVLKYFNSLNIKFIFRSKSGANAKDILKLMKTDYESGLLRSTKSERFTKSILTCFSGNGYFHNIYKGKEHLPENLDDI